MDRASSCDSLREDLTSLCDELAQCIDVFVIYCKILVGTELAYFLSSVAAASFIHCHGSFSFPLERKVIVVYRLEALRQSG